jgi:hypothetical protein
VSRLLTPAEIEALRAVDSFVPAPTETFRVSVEAGSTEIAPEAVASLEPGVVLPLSVAVPGLVEIVANAVVVAYGRLEERDGGLSVRVMQLAQGRAGRIQGSGGIR